MPEFHFLPDESLEKAGALEKLFASLDRDKGKSSNG